MSVLKRLHLLLHSSQLLPQLLVAGPLDFELVALLLQILD